MDPTVQQCRTGTPGEGICRMGTRLEHKTALVTGATSNIGRAIVTAFAAEGAQVVVSGRSRERGAEVVGEIRSAGAAPTSWPPTSTALRRPPGTWARRRPAC